jgi:imidazoleglycerol phosphate synthase glutamine amidotransferase subunit HisH
MKKEVRQILVSKSKEQLKEWGLNWKTIQKVDIKKKYKFPIGWRTLHKLVKNKDHVTPEQIQMDLLDFYSIEYSHTPSIISISKQKPNA